MLRNGSGTCRNLSNVINGAFSAVRLNRRPQTLPAVVSLIVGLCLAMVLFARVLGVVVTQLEQRGFALLHQCVPDGGALSWLGMHLAVVRTSVECPAGTLALGGQPDGVAAVVAAITLPVLLLHFGGGFAGMGLVAHLRKSLARCVHLGRRLRFAVLTVVGLPVAPDVSPALPRTEVARMPRRLALALVPVRRGPPLVCAG